MVRVTGGCSALREKFQLDAPQSALLHQNFKPQAQHRGALPGPTNTTTTPHSTMADVRVLLVGNGGREHAIAWKLSQSPRIDQIFVVPGNGGTGALTKTQNVESIRADDFPALSKFALENNVNLLIPGPEAPLVDGIVDHFNKHAPQVKCFGPSGSAARMEGSKTFSKDFMHRYNIPTAAYQNFTSHDAAKAYLDSVSHPVVIKASGLAAGKGVIIPTTKEEAHQALKDIMLDREFGSAGDEVVIEEFLEGDELSILTFSDGTSIQSLPPAQDHKRIFDGDQGPNTGGMGTYSPTRIAPKDVVDRVEKEVLQPTVDGMKAEGMFALEILEVAAWLTTDCRLSHGWLPVHWSHDDQERSQGSGVQRPLRRS